MCSLLIQGSPVEVKALAHIVSTDKSIPKIQRDTQRSKPETLTIHLKKGLVTESEPHSVLSHRQGLNWGLDSHGMRSMN